MKMRSFKQVVLTLLLAVVGSMAFAQRTSTTVSGGTYMSIDEDSSVSPVQTLITYRNGPLYIMKLENEKLVDLYINGRKIPADSFAVYNALVEKILVQMKKDREQARLDRIQAGKDRAQAERDREQSVKDREQAEKDRGQAIKDRAQSEKDREQGQRDAAQAREDSKQSVVERAQANRDREQSVRDRAQAEKDRSQAMKDREQAERDREQAVKDRAQAEVDRKQAEIDRALMKSMMEEIVKDGLAPDEKSIRSVELDEDALFINGKKQTDALRDKYKGKYIKTPSGRISVHRGAMSYSN